MTSFGNRMGNRGKLMEMLTGYAASHQHPANVLVHLVGIPTIMLGVMVPLTWAGIEVGGVPVNLAHVLVAGFVLFYLTLDAVFAAAFMLFALLIAELARRIGSQPLAVSGTLAAMAFFGGYALQFVGHAIEKSLPVLVKHPIQANLAAPFFQIVEVFKLLGLRDELFNELQQQVAARRRQQADF